MEQIVVDASTIIAVITNQPEKAQLVLATSGAELIGPASIHFEIGNAFSAMLKRGRIDLEQCRKALALYGHLPIRLTEVDLGAAMGIAAQFEIYAYDAYLIHCAHRYHAPLLTLDRALQRNAAAYGVDVLETEK